MRKLIWVLFSIMFITIFSCTKNDGSSNGNTTAKEVAIDFTINPDPGNTIYPALAATQDFSVTIISKLPSSGVIIDLSLTKDLDGSSVFSQSLKSSLSNLTTTFQNMQSGVVYNAVIKITSASTASNSFSKSFKIAKK